MADDEARRAAIRKRLVAQDQAIDERYRGRPIGWDGPLETDEDIAAAAVAMQREAEGEAGQRVVLVRESFKTLTELTGAIEAVRTLGESFCVIWQTDNVVQHHDPRAGGRWTVRQVPAVDELGIDTTHQDAAMREMTMGALSGRDEGAFERELTATHVLFNRDRTPEDEAELRRKALDVLRRVPRVPPDPGDEMPPEQSVVLRRTDTMSGVPIFRGTRMPVSTLFDYLADGYALAEIVHTFPTLDREDCERAIRQAGRLLADRAPDETPD